ncbi:ADYC domain-containing protein [Microvirga sp. 2TAF3]|uniref:ADYC domain-containing protein n=1 Tax=Microvirga sp. 2TAF3 TaxID=3233014 RepID=UPI003F99DD25
MSMHFLFRAVCCCFVLCGAALTGAAFGLGGRLQAEGPEFVLRLDDGRVLRREMLVGLRLMLATSTGDRQVRIDGLEEDASAAGGPLLLYRLSIQSPGHASEDFCRPDIKGRRAGFPVPDGAGGFNLTCTSGAEGKCILMGYRPWEARDGVPMRDLFRACIHMIRADYGGDDRPTTRDGMSIDVYDRFGIQAPASMSDTMAFEAGWSPAGAVCVAHPRIPDHITLAQLAERYPQLSGHLGPQACSDETARADPQALLFNRSAATKP